MITKEKQFLIDLALEIWSRQTTKTLKPELLDVETIRNNPDFQYGFHVFMVTMTEFVEWRLYFNLSDKTEMRDFRLELDGVSMLGRLEDEKYVSVGSVSWQSVRDANLDFSNVSADWSKWPIWLCEDGSPMLAEDGNFILLESAVTFEDLRMRILGF